MDAPTVERQLARPPPRTVVLKEIVARSSFERGHVPEPGAYEPPYRWHDLVDGPPPRRHARGEGAYVVYHGMDVSPEERISFGTLVSVDPGNDPDSPLDDVIHVDTRIGVQRTRFMELMDRERRFTDRLTSRWRERLGRRLVRQRRVAARVRPAWLRRLALAGVRVQAKAGLAFIRGTRRTLRSIAAVPESFVTRSIRARTHLGARSGRRSMWAGLKDPSKLSNEQKSVVLFASVVAVFGLILVLNTLFTLVFPEHAGTYRRVFGDATVALLAVLAFPFAVESLVISSTLVLGPALAFGAFFVGKMVGVWLLYFLGDSIYEAVEKRAKRAPRTLAAVKRVQATANRIGWPLLMFINAIPWVPDFFLYVFAISGMRFRAYFSGIAFGTALKVGGIALGVMLLGPDRVHDILLLRFR